MKNVRPNDESSKYVSPEEVEPSSESPEEHLRSVSGTLNIRGQHLPASWASSFRRNRTSQFHHNPHPLNENSSRKENNAKSSTRVLIFRSYIWAVPSTSSNSQNRYQHALQNWRDSILWRVDTISHGCIAKDRCHLFSSVTVEVHISGAKECEIWLSTNEKSKRLLPWTRQSITWNVL